MRRRGPYESGDPISVLTYHPTHGTVLATRRVQHIRQSPTNGEWIIRWTNIDGTVITTRVDERGRDRHGYVRPVR